MKTILINLGFSYVAWQEAHCSKLIPYYAINLHNGAQEKAYGNIRIEKNYK